MGGGGCRGRRPACIGACTDVPVFWGRGCTAQRTMNRPVLRGLTVRLDPEDGLVLVLTDWTGRFTRPVTSRLESKGLLCSPPDQYSFFSRCDQGEPQGLPGLPALPSPTLPRGLHGPGAPALRVLRQNRPRNPAGPERGLTGTGWALTTGGNERKQLGTDGCKLSK